jgi:hypothetical protein
VIAYLPPPPLGDFQVSWKHGDAEARWVGSGRDLEVTSVQLDGSAFIYYDNESGLENG